MQLVIELPDNFKDYVEDVLVGVGDAREVLVNAVMDGIQLPKRHGRLIDEDVFRSRIKKYDTDDEDEKMLYHFAFNEMMKAPSVLRARRMEE
jgi:hypothetical protein